MSDYPHEWEVLPLGEVVEKITSGGTPKADNPDLYGGDIPFLKIDDITSSSKYLKSHKVTINERGLSESSAKVVPAGTLLLTMYGTIGRCCITTYPVATNQAIASFLGHPRVELEYLYYALENKAVEFAVASSQTTQANISAGILKKTPIAIPPLPEQKKIADILSGIDSCISTYQQKARVLTMTHEVIASRIYMDMHKDPTSCIKRIDEISTLRGGNGFPVEHQGRTAGGTPFIKVSDFNTPGNENSILNANNYLSTESMEKLRPHIFPEDTIVFAKVGAALTSNRRRILSMPTCIDNNLMGAIPGNINPLYLKFLLERIDFNEFVQDGAVPSVNQSQVGQVEVPVPSMDRQAEVIGALESLRQSKNLLDSIINKRIFLKQAIATDLLSGLKRVSV